MSGSRVPFETHFFDQYVFLDFTIPNLFNVKGKIGAYENSPKVRARLTTQIAVVTGGGSGIGTMIASAYVQNGAKVYIASRKEGQLKEVGRDAATAYTHVWYDRPD
jgi:short chain dehydrogenase